MMEPFQSQKINTRAKRAKRGWSHSILFWSFGIKVGAPHSNDLDAHCLEFLPSCCPSPWRVLYSDRSPKFKFLGLPKLAIIA